MLHLLTWPQSLPILKTTLTGMTKIQLEQIQRRLRELLPEAILWNIWIALTYLFYLKQVNLLRLSLETKGGSGFG